MAVFHYRYRGILGSAITVPAVLPYSRYRTHGITVKFLPFRGITVFPITVLLSNLDTTALSVAREYARDKSVLHRDLRKNSL